MGLLSKLKSLFRGDEPASNKRNVDITLEREGATDSTTETTTESTTEDTEESDTETPERSTSDATGESDTERVEPNTATEAAVKEPVAEGTAAAASTESLVDDDVEEGDAEPDERAEPAEASAGQPSADDMETDVEDVDPTDDDEADVADSESEADVELIKGIGPAYADRLREAGAPTVGELADSDVDNLADDIDLSPKRVGRWRDRAKDRLEK